MIVICKNWKVRLVSPVTNPGLKPGVSDDAMHVDFSPSTTSVLKAGVRIG